MFLGQQLVKVHHTKAAHARVWLTFFEFYLRTPLAKIWITVGVGQNLCRSSIASDLILYAEAFCSVLSNVLLPLVILTIRESGKQANEVLLAA